MKRRTFLLTGSAAALARGARSRENDRPPNIILLLTDDQRADSIGLAGNRIIRTQHLDGLGRRGVLFRRAYVTTSICPASRASIFTGQYARRHRIFDFDTPMSDELFKESYPSMLRSHGYFTGFIGKYGIGPSYSDDKFDFMRAFNGQGKYEIRGSNGEVRHLTALNGDDALEFLGWCMPDKPFCLSVSFKAPHAEDLDLRQYIADEVDQGLYDELVIPAPDGPAPDIYNGFPEFFRKDNEGRRRWQLRFSSPELYQRMVKAYYRLVTGVDRVVGRIVDELSRRGLLDKTVIIFSSDNGVYLGEHGLADKWFGHEPSISRAFDHNRLPTVGLRRG